MVKELSLAILLGGILGFILTGGILGLKSNKPLTQKPTPTPITSPSPGVNPTVTPTPSIELNITQPENESVYATAKIDVQGSTSAKSTVIIKTEKDVYNGLSDTSGNFSIPIELEAGLNLVQVTSIDDQDNQKDVDLIVTYSTAKI